MIKWVTVDGMTFGYLDNGYEIEISAASDEAQAAKWGERYRPGRYWTVYDPNNAIVDGGHSPDLRVAKRDSLSAVTKIAPTN